MCGICGILDRRALSPPRQAITAMLPALSRRGPDDEGIHVEPGVALGHSRLAILDLSPAGHQPMLDPDLDLVIAFNGEIYNFRPLRAELEALGYQFRSRSDTEVLLKAYHAWGDGFVERLNGMFAFCLYDRARRRALLARDRLGIKPLYYSDGPLGLVFASNIQALAKAGSTRSACTTT
jgi:asparagine synthase (glutamine-hydrolysing)